MSKPTMILLLRHGDVYNPQNIMFNRMPGYHLSEEGKNEAEKLGNTLKSYPISILFTSPLERAEETAAIIAEINFIKTVLTDQRLIEVESTAAGISLETIYHQYNYDTYIPEFLDKGGETLYDVEKRIISFMEEMRATHACKTIAAVTHGDLIQIARNHYENLPITFPAVHEGYVTHCQGIVFSWTTNQKPTVSVIPN
jgi:broad specificity phosphatase PhoE